MLQIQKHDDLHDDIAKGLRGPMAVELFSEMKEDKETDAGLSEEKFNNSSVENQVTLIREELIVLLIERWMLINKFRKIDYLSNLSNEYRVCFIHFATNLCGCDDAFLRRYVLLNNEKFTYDNTILPSIDIIKNIVNSIEVVDYTPFVFDNMISLSLLSKFIPSSLTEDENNYIIDNHVISKSFFTSFLFNNLLLYKDYMIAYSLGNEFIIYNLLTETFVVQDSRFTNPTYIGELKIKHLYSDVYEVDLKYVDYRNTKIYEDLDGHFVPDFDYVKNFHIFRLSCSYSTTKTTSTTFSFDSYRPDSTLDIKIVKDLICHIVFDYVADLSTLHEDAVDNIQESPSDSDCIDKYVKKIYSFTRKEIYLDPKFKVKNDVKYMIRILNYFKAHNKSFYIEIAEALTEIRDSLPLIYPNSVGEMNEDDMLDEVEAYLNRRKLLFTQNSCESELKTYEEMNGVISLLDIFFNRD